MKKIDHSLTRVQKRKKRVSSKIVGTPQRPRLVIFRSNQHTYLQVVDDENGKTVAAAHDKTAAKKGTKTERAVETAQVLAADLKKKKIAALVVDRGQYRYHGRIKAVAEILREQGIKV